MSALLRSCIILLDRKVFAFFCASAVSGWNFDTENFNPQCADCIAKPLIENEKERNPNSFVVLVFYPEVPGHMNLVVFIFLF